MLNPTASARPTLRILGTRGVPARHGGFETFAEQLARHLVRRGWRVVVYCQEDGAGPVQLDEWEGIERVRIPVDRPGAAGTVVFDWRATRHAARHPDLCLTLGYNTAVFGALLRRRGVPNVTNMDGIEWQRAKWGPLAKAWFRLNELAGCWLSDHLVADHPQIEAHLRRWAAADRITMIPYGAERVVAPPTDALAPWGLVPGRYLTVVARPEPENSLLEIVSGFSARPRGVRLVVLGRYEDGNAYHAAVRAAAGPEVDFVGAIYEPPRVQALRFHAAAYVHGHQVGGTNPSLVEALGAGNAVLAHDNRFNRWVCGEGALYFDGATGFSEALERLLGDDALRATLARRNADRFAAAFTWEKVLGAYEQLLLQWLPGARAHALPEPR